MLLLSIFRSVSVKTVPESGMYRRGGYGGYGGYRRPRDSRGLALSLVMHLAQQYNRLPPNKPPVTTLLLAANVVAFFVPDVLPAVSESCINPSKMQAPGAFLTRSFRAAFTHADAVHLYANMSSMIFKGYWLEQRGRYPAQKLLLLVIELVVTSSAIYCVMARVLPGIGLWQSCAVGFSAVLFAMKVVLHDCEAREGVRGRRGGFQTASWIELLVGQFVSSQYGGMTSVGSAVGHGCGVLAGLVHVHVTKRAFYAN